LNKMKAIILLGLVVLCAAVKDQMREEFVKFQLKYNKAYQSQEEFNRRYAIFQENMRISAQLNKKNPLHNAGVTKFSDLTKDEFKALMLMKKSPRTVHDPARNANFTQLKNVKVPATFDWRDKGVVTPVYNQGQCGSCWAFSATENIESVWKLAGHTLTDLSMQQIVDCDTTDSGCDGGDLPTAFAYVISQGGMDDLNDYPYTGEDGTCSFKQSEVAAKITGWEYATQNSDEKIMQQYLVAHAPLAICVDASTWQNYNGGIITPDWGCGDSLDHCVMATGYGTQQGTNYWIVRNSWGTDWGISGYLYIQMGSDICGVADEAACTKA